jgi:hypothetical protein
MFDQLFKSKAAAKHHFGAPLCSERLLYLRHLEQRGAARATLIKTASYLVAAVTCLGWVSSADITKPQIEMAAELWVRWQPGRPRKRDGRATRTAFLSIATDWFRFLGVLRVDHIEPSYSAQLEAFTTHLSDERALCLTTIRMLRCRATELLDFLVAQNVSLDKISLEMVDKLTAIKPVQAS